MYVIIDAQELGIMMVLKIGRYITALLLLLLSGCLSFFQQPPRYLEGTDLEIRTGESGEDYVAQIGKSSTTVVEAILSGNRYYSIAYKYTGSEWLKADRLIIETSCCINRVDIQDPSMNDREGMVIETGQREVRRELFKQMVNSDTPVINIRGEQGNVIIKMGSESKRRLQELLNYGEKRFPES